MPPEPGEFIKDVSSPENSYAATPTPSVSSVEEQTTTSSSDSDLVQLDPNSIILYRKFKIPIEPTLRELLIQISGTKNLESVTKVKLRVIARDLGLQHLRIHTPYLQELILDGSVVNTLRELGCGLKNLKILRVNRCGLDSLDGIYGFENIEEFYASDNAIEDASPFLGVDTVKVVDLKRNRLKSLNALGFLTLCPKLEQINLEGNEGITKSPTYRKSLKTLIPQLKVLDDEPFFGDENQNIAQISAQEEGADEVSSYVREEDELMIIAIPQKMPVTDKKVFSGANKQLAKECSEATIDLEVNKMERIDFVDIRPPIKLRHGFFPPIPINKRTLASENRPSSAGSSNSYAINFPPRVLSTTSNRPTTSKDTSIIRSTIATESSVDTVFPKIKKDYIKTTSLTAWDDDLDEM